MVNVEHGPQDASLGGQACPRQPLAGDVAPPPQGQQPPHCGRETATASAPASGVPQRSRLPRPASTHPPTDRPTDRPTDPPQTPPSRTAPASRPPSGPRPSPAQPSSAQLSSAQLNPARPPRRGPAGCLAASATVALLAGQGTSSRFHAASGAAIFPGVGRRCAGQGGRPNAGGTMLAGVGGPDQVTPGRVGLLLSGAGPPAGRPGGGCPSWASLLGPRCLACLRPFPARHGSCAAGCLAPRRISSRASPATRGRGELRAARCRREREGPSRGPGQAPWHG